MSAYSCSIFFFSRIQTSAFGCSELLKELQQMNIKHKDSPDEENPEDNIGGQPSEKGVLKDR